MTIATDAPVERSPERTEPRPPARSARRALPLWLRTPPRRTVVRRPVPTPRDLRWWAGVIWLVVSALGVGLVAHVTLVGSLQHSRAQQVLYQELRSDLAKAEAPLGQLDFNGTLVASGTPIALIEIDGIGVEEVVVQGTTPTDLMSGPGHRRDTVYPGQVGTSVIMGRQSTYGGPFSGIYRLQIGDEIRITTGQGVATYEVFGVRREGDLLPVPIEKGDGRLELITADGTPLSPAGSIHVDAELTSKAQDTPDPSFSAAVLDASELEMGADPLWPPSIPTLFWITMLAAASIAVRWTLSRWGRWQTWVVALPVLLVLGAANASDAITKFPNLL